MVESIILREKSGYYFHTAMMLCMVLSIGQACKSATANTMVITTYDIVLHLSGNSVPAGLDEVRELQMIKSNRISRSQNKWMITIQTNKKIDNILEALRSSREVISAELPDSAIAGPSNNTNTKKGKTNPIKSDQK